MNKSDSNVFTPLSAVTATTTSSAIPIDDVIGVTLMFTRADHSSGSSAFKVTVSLDGTTYVDYDKMIDNATNTNSQNLTRITTKTLSANGSDTCYLDLEKEPFKFMKVTVTETTDGTHTAKAVLRY